jgi:hypothetical protein
MNLLLSVCVRVRDNIRKRSKAGGPNVAGSAHGGSTQVVAGNVQESVDLGAVKVAQYGSKAAEEYWELDLNDLL